MKINSQTVQQAKYTSFFAILLKLIYFIVFALPPGYGVCCAFGITINAIYKVYVYYYNCFFPIHLIVNRGYLLLRDAAYINQTKSQELTAYAYLFGNHLPMNLTGSKDMFQRLTNKGYPKGQTVNIQIYKALISISRSEI